jgi:hypothetical protein
MSEQWEQGLRYLRKYNAREGHSRVPSAHIEKGFPLGNWVHHRRRGRHKLPAERRRQLDELGFIWKPFEEDWNEGFAHLKAYSEREGHSRVPSRHIENGFPLGTWVGVQRSIKDKMSAERRKRLDKLGFAWKAR